MNPQMQINYVFVRKMIRVSRFQEFGVPRKLDL